MTENIQKEPANDVLQDDMKWTVLESEYLFRRPWLTARRDKVRLPNGNINPEFYVLEYPDWVNVIAITDEGRFIIERQYRHGIGSAGWEIPAGVCEKGETPEQAARRELLEETGYGDGEWTLSLVSRKARHRSRPPAASCLKRPAMVTAHGLSALYRHPMPAPATTTATAL